jgi:hypothetical protein
MPSLLHSSPAVYGDHRFRDARPAQAGDTKRTEAGLRSVRSKPSGARLCPLRTVSKAAARSAFTLRQIDSSADSEVRPGPCGARLLGLARVACQVGIIAE